MGKSPRKHSREFKIEAVKQVVEQGRTVAAVADGLGLNSNLLSRWKRKFEEEGAVAFPGKGRQTEAEAEITRLKRNRPGHRSRISARTSHHSLVIDESELANSTRNGLGCIYG
jgi:transposase-like protein